MFKQFIEENKRLIVFLLISVIINIMLFLFITFPLYNRAVDLKESNMGLLSENEKLDKEWTDKGKIVARVESTAGIIESLESSIPLKEGGLEGFISRLESWNNELNLNILDLVFSYEKLENDILMIRTTLKMIGSYEDFKKFLYYLETNENVIAAESLMINETSEEAVEMQVGLMAYFYEKEV